VAKPDDVYNPIPTVSPQTGTPNDYLNVRATPADMGSQVGQALQGAGNTLDKLGDQAVNLAIQQQGMINETLATNAESAYAAETGSIYGKYKALTGLDAVHARDGTVNDILGVRQKIRSTLPNPAAQRAFDLLAVRREGFMVQDINAYAGGQIKVADTHSAMAAQSIAIESAGRPEIASNDLLFNKAIGDIKFQAARIMMNQGYGSVMHQDPVKGTITFDDTPEGKQASVVWQDYLNKAVGDAWEYRIKALLTDPASGNVQTAVKVLNDNKANIPSATLAKLQAMLYAPYRQAQVRNIAQDVLAEADQNYLADISGDIKGKFNPAQLTNAIIGQESGGHPNVVNAISGATGLGQIMPDTWKAYARPGEDIKNPKDNKAVTQRILTDLLNKYDGDVERAAVAYYSGPSNVAPAGSATPWLKDISKDRHGNDIPSVSTYVKSIVSRLQGGAGGSSNYVPKVDWLEEHYGDLILKSRQQADQMYPDDPALADAAVRNTESRIREIIQSQRMTDRANEDVLIRAANGQYTNGKPITDPSQFDAIPEVRDLWNRYQMDNPLGAEMFGKMLRYNTHGASNTFGSDFYKYFTDVVSGHTTDPTQLLTGVNPDVVPKDSPLSNSGFNTLYGVFKDMGTPQGHSNWQAAMNFLNSPSIRRAITMSGASPGWVDADGDAHWNRYMMDVLPKIKAGFDKGLTPAQLFDPKSKDYVGGSLDLYRRSMKEIMADAQKKLLSGTNITGPNSPIWGTARDAVKGFDLSTIKTKDDWDKATKDPKFIMDLKNKKITKEQFMDLYNKFNPPPVPREH
jgi:hypothetical protein